MKTGSGAISGAVRLPDRRHEVADLVRGVG